ncbi:Spermatogenesis-defective protein 39 -like protein, partial [Takifugu flavidus]
MSDGDCPSDTQTMKSNTDDEEFWTRSRLGAFDFGPEDEVKESRQAVNQISHMVELNNDDDMQKFSWSGDPVGSISWSVRETELSSQSTEKGVADTPSIIKSNSGYSLTSLFKGKAKGGLPEKNFLSFSDVLDDSPARLHTAEIRNPKFEYKDFTSDWSPEESSRRLQQGKAVPLEKFRSLRDKLSLLDSAISTNDGNVITAVLIHLKRTLSREVLFRELASRPTALRHFIQYLNETGEQKVLLQLLGALGRTEEAALLQYKEHLSITDDNKRRDFLKSCLRLPFSAEDSAHVEDHFTLLERQIMIQVWFYYPFLHRFWCLIHLSLCLCQGNFSSPLNIRQTFKITEKQYFMTALAARAEMKAWPDVDALFTSRKWLGLTRKKPPLSFQRVVDILQKNSAPTQVLQDYVAMVEDAELRISLAQKHNCHDIVINMYRDQKDRQQMIRYRGKVGRGSAEERKIDELLNNM